MPNEYTARQAPSRKRETTLREAVTGRIEAFFELHGLDAAIKKFDDMKIDFSGCHDWPDIERSVMQFLMEKKHEADFAHTERQQNLENAWIEAVTKNGIKQANLLTGCGAQATFTTIPSIGGHKQ